MVIEFIGVQQSLSFFGVPGFWPVALSAALLFAVMAGTYRYWERFLITLVIANFVTFPMAYFAHAGVTSAVSGAVPSLLGGGITPRRSQSLESLVLVPMPRGAEEDHTFALIVRIGHCVVGQRPLTHPAVVDGAHTVSSSPISAGRRPSSGASSQCARSLQIGLIAIIILKQPQERVPRGPLAGWSHGQIRSTLPSAVSPVAALADCCLDRMR
jgi:hypothetical protein